MKTKLLTDLTVRELCEGFVYSELEGKGLFGLSGRLVVQPEYQRHYIYGDGKKDAAVIQSVLDGYPLGLLYFVKTGEDAQGRDLLEVLDGQQRITSLGRFVTSKFSIQGPNGQIISFHSMPENMRQRIFDARLLIYVCEGGESEIKEWFETINIAGVPLNTQELLNAIYSGPFVTAAKQVFANSQNANVHKWKAYVDGDIKRQDYLAVALDWASKGRTQAYMDQHRHDAGAVGHLIAYFNSVIDWAAGVFPKTYKQMAKLDWGRLYETYKDRAYDRNHVGERVAALIGDFAIKKPQNVFEYVLGGEADTRLLDVRVFDEAVKRWAHAQQTAAAKAAGVSNCSSCASGHDANKSRIWEQSEMDADHVKAWTKGGATEKENCEMLCKHHNRSKGNA
jgi:hypothetical protein